MLVERCNTTDPRIAEALAIVWALQLARLEKFLDIQVEGDAQSCFNAINGHTTDIPWKILQVISNVKVLASLFKSCSFVWVRRSANSVRTLWPKRPLPLPLAFIETTPISFPLFARLGLEIWGSLVL